jgi:hypothetical protein
MGTSDKERNPPMASGGSGNGGSRSVLLACKVSSPYYELERVG